MTTAHSFYERYWLETAAQVKDFQRKWPKLSRFIPREPGVHILDVGCGDGRFVCAMSALNPQARFTGVDVSQAALDLAAKAAPHAAFHRIADGAPLPLADASVDFILATEVIEHVYDTEAMFREMARVLKPGGRLLITTPYHGFLKNLVRVAVWFDRHFDPTGPHIRFFSNRALDRCLRTAGLARLARGYFGLFRPLSFSVFVLAGKRARTSSTTGVDP